MRDRVAWPAPFSAPPLSPPPGRSTFRLIRPAPSNPYPDRLIEKGEGGPLKRETAHAHPLPTRCSLLTGKLPLLRQERHGKSILRLPPSDWRRPTRPKSPCSSSSCSHSYLVLLRLPSRLASLASLRLCIRGQASQLYFHPASAHANATSLLLHPYRSRAVLSPSRPSSTRRRQHARTATRIATPVTQSPRPLSTSKMTDAELDRDWQPNGRRPQS